MYVTVDSCNYKLEKDDLCVSELFEMLDSVKVEIGILDWGIKMTTLEDGKDVQCTMSLYARQSTVTVTLPPPHTLLCTLYLLLPSASRSLPLSSLPPSLPPAPLSPVFLNIVKHSEDQRIKVSASICPVWLPCQQCFHRRKVLDE